MNNISFDRASVPASALSLSSALPLKRTRSCPELSNYAELLTAAENYLSDPRAAKKAAKKLLYNDPLNTGIILLYAEAYERLEKNNEALKLYNKAIKLNTILKTGYSHIYFRSRAFFYYKLGNKEDNKFFTYALMDIQRTLSKNPKDFIAVDLNYRIHSITVAHTEGVIDRVRLRRFSDPGSPISPLLPMDPASPINPLLTTFKDRAIKEEGKGKKK